MRVVASATAAVYAVMFFAAAVTKIDSWPRWRATVVTLWRSSTVRVVQWGLPSVEVAVAVLIFFLPAQGLLAATGLLGGLAIGVGVLSRRRRGTPCNCFGALTPSTIGPALAGRNALLMMGSLAGSRLAILTRLHALSVAQALMAAVVACAVVVVTEFHSLSRSARAESSIG